MAGSSARAAKNFRPAALLLVMTVTVGAQSLPGGSADKEGISTDRLAALGRRYQAGVDAGEIPGAVVMIARNGRLVYERAFGFAEPADRAPMTPGTLFRLASLTKPITSVAVMQLVDQGRVTLHEPIATYLPELKDLKVGIETGDAAGQPPALAGRGGPAADGAGPSAPHLRLRLRSVR